nr:hypothetical protein [uncultured Flavobacterium sp.]
MRNLFLCLFLCLFLQSCKGQSIIVDSEKDNDVIIFNLSNYDVSLINLPEKHYLPDTKRYWETNPKFNTEIYSKNKFVIFKQRWQNIGYGYGEKYYNFINSKKDTMNIKCFCPQETNYFFKNLEFRKGKFELSFAFPKKQNEQTKKYESQINYILGNQIKTPQEVQSVLFKNSYVWWETKGEFKNIFFKDLKFVEIDLNDSTNVKLKKLD